MPHGGVIAEVGVWRGDFSERILSRLKPARLHLVDPWTFVRQYDESWYGGSIATSQDDMDEIFEGVQRRFATHIAAGRVVVHRVASVAAAQALAAELFDVVYIDGDHTYDAVRADLQAWAPLVSRRGFLAGDDYVSGGWWEGGVKRAVDEFTRSDWDLTLLGDQFAFRRASPQHHVAGPQITPLQKIPDSPQSGTGQSF
jgi:hypothetical protein